MGEVKLVTGTMEPNDIKQGHLGDCYYLSAIASVAELQERIKKVFVTTETNAAGCYVVRLCIAGEFHEIVLDDKLPTNEDGKSFCFSKSVGDEIWVQLLEKAWAKVNGTYENIISGMSGEGLRAFTGAPCFYWNHKEEDKDVLWDKIKNGETNNYFMCAGTLSKREVTKRVDYDKKGLVSGHAYSLLSAVEIEHP
jgi:calpain-15